VSIFSLILEQVGALSLNFERIHDLFSKVLYNFRGTGKYLIKLERDQIFFGAILLVFKSTFLKENLYFKSIINNWETVTVLRIQIH
jgi:hypothetical protein